MKCSNECDGESQESEENGYRLRIWRRPCSPCIVKKGDCDGKPEKGDEEMCRWEMRVYVNE